jgi:hypothetical protein
MVERFASPQVFVRRYAASEICDVVVLVRGQEMVLCCPDFRLAKTAPRKKVDEKRGWVYYKRR